MKKILTFIILVIITLQVQAGKQELMEREKRKLLALRELVLQKIQEAGHDKNQDLQFKAEIRETNKGTLVRITEISSAGREIAMAKDKKTIQFAQPTRKKNSRAFYNDMNHLNP